MIIAENAGGMAIGESDLDGVVADGGSGLRARLGLEHGERGGRGGGAGGGGLADALVVAGGAGTFLAEVGKIVMAGVAVGPEDVDTSAGGYVNLYGRGLFSGVDGNGHVG